MDPLRLSPLPVLRAEDETGSLHMERHGFVDEDVVAALVLGPNALSRQSAYPEDLALAPDDLDFAGWSLTPPPEPRLIVTPPNVVVHPSSGDERPRRPAPPVMEEEAGLDSPHSGSHRWWLAGLAGVLSTMLFSLLLLNLSSRPGTRFEAFFVPRAPDISAPVSTTKVNSPQVAAELTKVSSDIP
ncbi:MAG: hypothetical protein ABI162_17215 [Luteolibacter sp.]